MLLIVSVFTAEDVQITSTLAHEIWMEHYPPIIGEAQTRYMLDRFQTADAILHDMEERSFRYYLARDDETGQPLGYCAVVPREDGVYISKLYIHHDARKKGLSRVFLNCVAEDFPNTKSLFLSVNKYNSGSIAAYRHLGFEIEASVKNDIGGGFFMDDYEMRKAL